MDVYEKMIARMKDHLSGKKKGPFKFKEEEIMEIKRKYPDRRDEVLALLYQIKSSETDPEK